MIFLSSFVVLFSDLVEVKLVDFVETKFGDFVKAIDWFSLH